MTMQSNEEILDHANNLYMPYDLMDSNNYISLSAHGVSLIMDMGIQYDGSNNGDLCATWEYASSRGWKSRDALSDAIQELIYYGFIVATQVGGLNRRSLYALGWFKIDKASKECEWVVGDEPNLWEEDKPKLAKPSKLRNQRKH